MTSTKFNIGLTDEARSSSRVLRPPGGGHTDIFGGDPEPPKGKRRMQNIIGNEALTQAEEARANGAAEKAEAEAPAPAEAPAQAPAEVPARAPAEAPGAKSEPAKRVRVPPGGFSSGLW